MKQSVLLVMVVFCFHWVVVDGVEINEMQQPSVIWHMSRQAPMVALTFDDGPTPEITPKILQVLLEKNVPATFFWLDIWLCVIQ